MKFFIIIVFLFVNLFSLSLKEYINLSLVNSDDSKVLIDTELNLKLDHSLQKNRFESTYTPQSSFDVDADGNSFVLGLQGEKANQYGGTVYGSIQASRFEFQNGRSVEFSPTFRAGYRQSLFRKFGKLYNTISIYRSEEQLKLVALIQKDTNAAIILRATLIYYTYALNAEKIKIQESAVTRSQKNYDAAKAKYESGIVSKIDVYRAKISYLDQKKNLKESTKRYYDSFEDLYFYINEDAEKKDKLKIDTDIIQYSRPSLEDIYIFQNNLEWNQMLLNEKLLERAMYNSQKDFLPDINLNVNYARSSSNEKFEKSFNFDQDTWSVGLSTDYSFNTTVQEVSNQRLFIQKSKLKRDKIALKRLINKEIKALKNDYQNILENLEIYDLKKIEAKNALEVATIRYERGLSSNLDIVDAESTYSNSQVDYITELSRHNIALFRLSEARGTLNLEFIQRIID